MSLDGTAVPLSEAIRIEPAEAEILPVMFRRGVTTGNRLLPAGAPRFNRTERIRLDFPVGAAAGGATPGTGRLLDRGGSATQVPVLVTERTEEGTGQRWMTADLALAALSPGDYAVELEVGAGGAPRKILTAIRVVR